MNVEISTFYKRLTYRAYGEKGTNMKTYYMANAEYHDRIYGSEMPVCIDLNEIKLLAREWDMTTAELLEQFHEATVEEIREYGISE